MPITKESYVERVLIVLNADGTLKGAHSQTLDKILEDGTLLRETQGDAVAVNATSLSSVLPDQAALVAQVQALTAERDALQTQVTTLEADKTTLEAEKAALHATADTVPALTSERDALKAERDALQAEVTALKPPADINGIPQEVSMYQARAALVGDGLYDAVNAAVAASADQLVKVAWEYATTVRRQSPFIQAMMPALNLDDATVDQIFVTAAAIN